MPIRISAKTFVIATILTVGIAVAHATPVVIFSTTYPTSAAEVDGVVVGGIDYNVTFSVANNYPTFDGQTALAFDAAEELVAALNASPADYVLSHYAATAVPTAFFDVLNGPAGRGIIVQNGLGYGYGQQGAWKVEGTAGFLSAGADFTPVSATPEPSSLLLGTGAIALWIVGRSRALRA